MLARLKQKKVIFILALILLGGFLLVRNPSSKKEGFKIAKVERKTLTKTISASGKVTSEREVNLKFQTSGEMVWVGVKEGDTVKKWQAIASLDKRELQKRFQKYANDYLGERGDFEQTQDDYQETRDRKLVTDTIQRTLDKAQYDLNKSVLDYEIADLAVKFATIYSPIDGIVTQVDIPVAGVNITPATATFTVTDPSAVVFSANADEVDVGQIRLGQEATITLDAYPDEEFRGKIEKINFTAVGTSGGGTAYPVTVALTQNEDLKFKVGMNGDLGVVTATREGVLAISGSAIFAREDKKYVWLVTGGKATKKEVKVGLETDDESEIIEGLGENDRIIAKDLSKVKEGENVVNTTP